MAATDKPYRNQKTLDVVFAASSVLMLVSVLWMFEQDFNREFKSVQRDFRDVEESLNEREMLDKLPDRSLVEAKRAEVEKARAALNEAKKKVQAEDSRLQAQHDLDDNAYRTVKAEYDSKYSYYTILQDDIDNEPSEARRQAMRKTLEQRKAELDRLQAQRDQAKAKLDATDLEYRQKVQSALDEPAKALSRAEDDLKKLTKNFDLFAKATAQKKWKMGDSFRALPIVDAFESPTKIKQIWLPDLTIDYGGFRDVPRYDRCTSCHLGIDRPLFEKSKLAALTVVPEKIADHLKQAREMLQERVKSGENVGFNVGDLPSSPRALKLNRGQITEYAVHPRLDLFVDGNSPHPLEKFGCTTCHAGQGSATDFVQAVHSPADTVQEEDWKETYGWHASHDWDFPMLSSRFIESSCLKCHHQVTDLIRYGSKEEAPKVLKGYNLVRENGCFGCHEIAGISKARWVGPDLRLEPTPALDLLTASEQEKAKADPLTPPGAMRRVGPGLRRLAEKTHEKWTRKWIRSPRGFREDTKMPHFYGLSTNTPGVPGGLAPEQDPFPDTEIHSIAHYLLTESKSNLQGKDVYRLALLSQLEKLQKDLLEGPLEDKDRKALQDASRRLNDLGLLSASTRANDINSYGTRQRLLQDRIQELYQSQVELQRRQQEFEKKSDLSDAEQQAQDKITRDLEQGKKDLEQAKKDLPGVTQSLIELARPVPVAERITNEDGEVVRIPDAAKDEKERQKHLTNGRLLFTERGCLACHAHDATGNASRDEDGPIPAIESQANFGPNLSRLAAKLGPDGGDALAKKRWLVQWLLNPNVHYARTRMPNVHLKVDQASDIADWILAQNGPDVAAWDQEPDVPAPSMENLVALARVYLSKAPGMTEKDVEEILPQKGGQVPGIPEERLKTMPADADEQALQGPIDDAKLKWYIGKKAIGRLGCYGCHDIPGFELAKPIGTALNDWGKKDPARLAFEDADAYVKEHYHIVPERKTRKEIEERIEKLKAKKDLTAEEKKDLEEQEKLVKEPWAVKDGKMPYEQFFAEALEHHLRDGFLHQKLAEPRSYDYHRRLAWDERLRMPQFQFARTRKHKDESDEDYLVRKTQEEAEAREAVMTFVLGLVAEPVPLKYVYNPNPDRLAEVKGRQVLEKYNCIGCHQVRPGVYEFKPTDDSIQKLEDAYKRATGSFATDHFFLNHNAWVGIPSPLPDRLMAYGTYRTQVKKGEDEDSAGPALVQVRLTDALRFTNNDRLVRDIPAGTSIQMPVDQMISESETFGGTFADLLAPYLMGRNSQQYKDMDIARSVLPPPLIREGERVQPRWLYQFLLNPPPVRPESYMVLRMPRFNMSGEESQILVNYFGAASKTGNPAAGVTYPYLSVPQQDDQYWKSRAEEYVKVLKENKKFDERLKQMEPEWEAAAKEKVARLKAGLEPARQAVKDAKDTTAKKEKETALTTLEASVKKAEEQLAKKDFAAQRQRWEERDVYINDAYKLVANKNICLACHSVGSVKAEGEKGPNLMLTAERLRPEWTEQWTANPARMFSYNTIMPQNFPRNSVQQWGEYFEGIPIDRVKAVRDVLMILPQLNNLPANRPNQVPLEGGK